MCKSSKRVEKTPTKTEKSSGIIHPNDAALALSGHKSCNFFGSHLFHEDLDDINFLLKKKLPQKKYWDDQL